MRREAVVVLCILTTACFGRWSGADEFRRALRCGSTLKDLRPLCDKFKAQLTLSDGSIAFGNYRVQRGNTIFWLFLIDGRLTAVREGLRSGITETSLFANTAVQISRRPFGALPRLIAI